MLLDADDERALQLLAQAQGALEDRQVQQCLVEARACLSSGDLSAASALIEQTLKLRADSPEAHELQRQIAARRRELAEAADRARSTSAAIERARRSYDDGAFEAALRAVSEALHYDAANQEALAIRQRATEAIEKARRAQERAEQQRVEQQRDAAGARPGRSGAKAAGGGSRRGRALLKGFDGSHPLVEEALTDTAASLEAHEREQQQLRDREAAKRRERRGGNAAGQAIIGSPRDGAGTPLPAATPPRRRDRQDHQGRHRQDAGEDPGLATAGRSRSRNSRSRRRSRGARPTRRRPHRVADDSTVDLPPTDPSARALAKRRHQSHRRPLRRRRRGEQVDRRCAGRFGRVRRWRCCSVVALPLWLSTPSAPATVEAEPAPAPAQNRGRRQLYRHHSERASAIPGARRRRRREPRAVGARVRT